MTTIGYSSSRRNIGASNAAPSIVLILFNRIRSFRDKFHLDAAPHHQGLITNDQQSLRSDLPIWEKMMLHRYLQRVFDGLSLEVMVDGRYGVASCGTPENYVFAFNNNLVAFCSRVATP